MARALVLAAVLLSLAGCSRQDETAPFAESRTPPGLAARFMAPEGWAWGFVEAGDAPVQRYGVAAPSGAPRSQVLILTGYGESAEAWFETARDLNARGTIVWVLERAGQGGSGRYATPRDLGHVADFGPDVAAVKAMREVVIRPDGRLPFVILAQDDAAVVALQAVEDGLRVDGLVLTSPRWPAAVGSARMPALLQSLGLGALSRPGWTRWRRDGPGGRAADQTHDPDRGQVQHAWQVANPDLRMSGPSLGWRAAFDRARGAAGKRLGAVHRPVLMLLPAGRRDPELGLCRELPDCAPLAIPGARRALHLERDPQRGRWLDEVSRFIAARRAGPPA